MEFFRNSLTRIVPGIASILLASATIAPTFAESNGSGLPPVTKTSYRLPQEIEAESGYVFGAKTGHGSTRSNGNVTEINSHVKYVVTPVVNQNLDLRLGVNWDRFSFGTSKMTPNPGVPDTLQSDEFILGADYKLNDKWLLRLEAAPGLIGTLDSITFDDVNMPVTLGASYIVNADLQWVFGIIADPRGEYPILPGVGVRWKFADRWTLNAIPPKPRIEYELTDAVTLFAGGSIYTGTYRTARNQGTEVGRSSLNNALVNYTEGRIGAGASWKILPNLTLDGEAGEMVYRDFHYYRAKADFKSSPAPYINIGVTGHF